MLSGVLHNGRATKVITRIIRVSVKMHEILETREELLRKPDYLERKDIEQDETVKSKSHPDTPEWLSN